MKRQNTRTPQLQASRRGEAILEPSLCACGCGITDLLDVRHGQKFIHGHGGIALLKRRKAALGYAVQIRLMAYGVGLLTAERVARVMVEKSLKFAQALVADTWDYLTMTWRTV